MNKILKQPLLIAVAFSTLIPTLSMAESQSEMSHFFREKMLGFEDKLSKLEQGNQTAVFPTMTFADINVQLGTSATFGITSVLSLSISPEIDFMVTPAATQ